MSDGDESPGRRFGALLRKARADQHLSQEQVVTESGVGEATYKRYEQGRVDNPYAAQVVAICRALKINPREAVIALGFGTRDDYDLPPEEPPYPQMITDIGRVLADEGRSAAKRAALEHAVVGAYESWRMTIAAIDERPTTRRS
ncbi:helix-turn-helix domain-containing protein [Dactylosporangium sp. CA-139066]|uniref:helix-turn-helix domain-containing protein n=1 Tax=Dactylosporangium sp. CA-139066 TaxID=3239930 RepID=UPI003D8A4F7B